MIASAHSQIRPLSKIEAYVKMATDGFAIFKAILNFFVSMNVVWICTSLPFVYRVKTRIYGVIALGFVAELLAILYPESDILGSLSEVDVIDMIRYWTRACGMAVLFISCIMSCVCPSKDDKDDYASRMDELLRSQMELVSTLSSAQNEDMLVAASRSKIHAVNDDRRTGSIRKYHAVPKRSRSKSAERRRSSIPAKKYPSLVTPYRPSIDKTNPTSTSKSEKATQHHTIKILKQMQHEHIDSEVDDHSSSKHDESVPDSGSSSKLSRKRKFSETWHEAQPLVVLRDAGHDDGSVSSVSTESFLSKASNSKKARAANC